MLLETQDLSKKFRRNGHEFFPVKDINLSVKEGQLVSISGSSGCGKSTLLNLITGMLTPDYGAVYFNKENVFEMTADRHAEYLNQNIAYIMQGDGLLHNLTLSENIALIHWLHNRENVSPEKIIKLAQSVGIEHVLDSYPAQLSGGEAKRGAIVRALVNHPQLVIADEPTSNLDTGNAEKIVKILKNLSRDGTAVIVSTHDQRFSEIVDAEYILGDC
ncbi:ABC transporter ATP-binding protein [Acetobacterium tundrae]|uniref:ATP-binding cassette domain-containing protein n=1 Tax=Acetobacterium tundrae TaxID=132932 RepID=A0ABR6WGL0_9FIRM|nr:ATP-binding cassette domain-containing protein [Acetobacterium tundrae]MBC3795617.1 ATP-binding cassette domain-containing protein [Acetobacterium tundrae]